MNRLAARGKPSRTGGFLPDRGNRTAGAAVLKMNPKFPMSSLPFPRFPLRKCRRRQPNLSISALNRRMCSGEVPQQPPRMFAPAFTRAGIPAAIIPGDS